MKIGTIHLWGDDLEIFRDEVRLCGELGYDFIGVGDSPAGWHDLHLSMAIAAQEAPAATIAPMVTSPFLRHPIVTANALCSLYDFSGGRIALGFGTGGSTVLSIGRQPATVAEMRAHIGVLRDLFAGNATEWEGTPVRPLRFQRPIPIMVSALGPKMLALAAELGDGAILFAGAGQMEKLEAQIAFIREATATRQNPASFKIWVTSFCSIQDTRQAAITDLKAFIAATPAAFPRTHEAWALIPGQFRDKITQYQARYDVTEHVVPGGRNTQLLDELGLAEFLSEFDTVLGPPEEVQPVLQKMAALGVDTFFAALPGLADRARTIRSLAELRPHDRSP